MCRHILSIGLVALGLTAVPSFAQAEEDSDLPSYLRDRGTGIPTSMFGTTIDRGEFLFYPFFEYYVDDNAEYAPSDLGFTGEEDFRGRYRAREGLVFLGYGVNERLALELEAAVIDARLEKSPDDSSEVPAVIEESGLGDVEGQVRWRWRAEDRERSEIFSYFEYVLPLQRDKLLIGTQDWEFKVGMGRVRGYDWGTMTMRLAIEYEVAETKFDLGEYALEYLRRLNSTWRIYGGIEGTQDEVELITEAQLHFNDNIVLKLNNAFGVTSKATDWAPEVGILFSTR